MKDVMLCSSNAILAKSLYGMLRDEGYRVDTAEHPSLAVQMTMTKEYDFVIIDSEPFGLSAEDAAEIIKTISPGIPVLFVGAGDENVRSGKRPLDLEEFRRTIHSMAV